MRTELRLFMALGALVTGAGATADAQTVRVTERVVTGRNIRSDSLMDLILTAEVGTVKRMVTDWNARETQLLTELRGTPEENVAQRRRLEEQLALHTRDGFAIMSAIQARCVEEGGPRPSGYLGLNLSNTFTVEAGRPKALGTTVTSVEPGSPAERAGIQRNDRVLALGGADATERTPDIAAQLVPGRTVTVRIDRAGTKRDLTLTVARRPEGFGESCGEFERALVPMRVPGPGRIVVEDASGGQQRVMVEGRRVDAMRAEPDGEMRLFVFGPGAMSHTARSFFAGAEFRNLDADWRELLGVRQGVLVSTVANGSAAGVSGLKSGDVIVTVDRAPVLSAELLVQMLGTLDAREAALGVVRAKESRTLTLKWGGR